MKTTQILLGLSVVFLAACGSSNESKSGAGSSVQPASAGLSSSKNSTDSIMPYLGFDQNPKTGLCNRQSLYAWYINETLLGKGANFGAEFVPVVSMHAAGRGHHLKVYDESVGRWVYDGYIAAFENQRILKDGTYHFSVQFENV